MILTTVEILLYFIFVGFVTYRILRYRYRKFNLENIGLLVLAGIMVKISEIPPLGSYLLLALDFAVFVILLAGMIRQKKSAS
jgi:hypothetical protein